MNLPAIKEIKTLSGGVKMPFNSSFKESLYESLNYIVGLSIPCEPLYEILFCMLLYLKHNLAIY